MDVLYYDMGSKVEAFTTRKASLLPYYVIQPHQIHGDVVSIIRDKNISRDSLEGVDALITNLKGCAIGVRTADCVPILLYDPKLQVIAAVHSGWRGTVNRILQKTILQMINYFGTDPNNLLAIIGPSIGPDSFYVHHDVKKAFTDAGFPMSFLCKEDKCGLFRIDLWAANEWLLKTVGVRTNNIQVSGICTFFHHDEFYSARYEKNNKCGRNINSIMLKDI